LQTSPHIEAGNKVVDTIVTTSAGSENPNHGREFAQIMLIEALRASSNYLFLHIRQEARGAAWKHRGSKSHATLGSAWEFELTRCN